MPIPIGILAVSGAGAAGSMEFITTYTVPSAVTSFTLSSIPQGYTHLYGILIGGSTDAANSSSGIRILYNGQTTYYVNGSNQAGPNSFATRSSSTNAEGVAFASIGAASTSGAFPNSFKDNPVEFLIQDYSSTTKNKIFTYDNPVLGNLRGYGAGVQDSTSAVTSLTFTAAFSRQWRAGSKVSIYGVKA
jgi:hypothetical protein